MSQQTVSLIEAGAFEVVGLDKVRAVAKALDATVALMVRWRGPELDRLLDSGHAALVEEVVARLRDADWVVITEWTFNHYGERGSVDVVGWHEGSAALLIVEVKTRIVDVQDLLASTDRKVRIASTLLPVERGWRPRSVSRLLVLPATSTAHDAMRRHAATFSNAFGARTRAIQRWVSVPDGPMAGVWFVPPTNGVGAVEVRSRRGGAAPRVPRSS